MNKVLQYFSSFSIRTPMKWVNQNVSGCDNVELSQWNTDAILLPRRHSNCRHIDVSVRLLQRSKESPLICLSSCIWWPGFGSFQSNGSLADGSPEAVDLLRHLSVVFVSTVMSSITVCFSPTTASLFSFLSVLPPQVAVHYHCCDSLMM